MARTIWICADCTTEISEVGRDIRINTASKQNEQFEYCFRCNNWDPTVVVAYR